MEKKKKKTKNGEVCTRVFRLRRFESPSKQSMKEELATIGDRFDREQGSIIGTTQRGRTFEIDRHKRVHNRSYIKDTDKAGGQAVPTYFFPLFFFFFLSRGGGVRSSRCAPRKPLQGFAVCGFALQHPPHRLNQPHYLIIHYNNQLANNCRTILERG